MSQVAAPPIDPMQDPTQDPAHPSLRTWADEVFDRVSPYPGVGLRNHCRRLFSFATMLMARRGIEMPSDTAYAIAMWHDLGIVSEQDEGATYLKRSLALFKRESKGFDLGGVVGSLLEECLVYNHRLFAVPNLSAQAECFRKAVQIEHTRGWLRFGLDRSEVKAQFVQHPRGNFDRVLLNFTWRTLRREPLTLVRGIFV